MPEELEELKGTVEKESKEKDPIIEKLKSDLRKYPARPHVGIGALIIYKNKLLLIQRKYNPDAQMWSIPGGHLDLGEKCKVCAEREVLEETGIKIQATELAGISDKIVYDEEGKILYHYVLLNYNTEITDDRFLVGIPELHALSDTQDIKFVPFEEILNFDITDTLKELLFNIGILKKE
jgi:ADP-ribose pyrophosphatase YjhB (NUDIX family)